MGEADERGERGGDACPAGRGTGGAPDARPSIKGGHLNAEGARLDAEEASQLQVEDIEQSCLQRGMPEIALDC